VFQKLLKIEGQKMTTFTLSTGENIVLEKVESITKVDHKQGYKGALYEYTIFMDSGREISVSHEENLFLIKEQESLLKAISKIK
jgi:hypothetical protein